jgi:myo-inositol-1(or 4)-monophosphatase
MLGSAALSLCQVAAGSGSVLVAPGGMRAFDCAAGLLLLRESGAVTTDLEGRPLDDLPLDFATRFPIVTSLSPDVHGRTLELLAEGAGR